MNCGTPEEAVYGFKDGKLFGICKSPFELMENGRFMFWNVKCNHG